MILLPYPMSSNSEAELSENNPVIWLLRNRVAGILLLLVSLLNPIEVFAANCQTQSPPVCIDSTPCKTVSGVEVCLAGVSPLPQGALQTAQPCWTAQGTYNCKDASIVNSTCGALQSNPNCGVINSVCSDPDPSNPASCLAYTDTYQCQQGGGVTGSQVDCSGQTYCSNGVCFNKGDKPNNKLVKAVTAMEVARESGFYIDPATMTIFKGDQGWCTENTLGLANCCKPNSKGMSATNALLVNQLIQSGWNSWVSGWVGSSYTFDTLFDQATGFVSSALSGMGDVLNGAVSAGYTGPVTGTANGTGAFGGATGSTQMTGAGVGGMVGGQIGQMAGSMLVANNGGNQIWQGVGGAVGYAAGYVAGTYAGAYASYATVALYNTGSLAASTAAGSAAGGQAVVSICWPCLIAMVVLMIIMALLACDVPEIKTQMKLGAKLCHEVGTYCSADDGLGQCLTMRHTQCCFNSKLARIVNEQGRPQIGKSWGDPKAPNCTGFTIDELQSLDFSKMDFSEFIADVVAQSSPDPKALSKQIQDKMNNYYSNTPASNMNGAVPPPIPGTPTALSVNTVSPNPPPPLPSCNWTLTKLAPIPSGDQTGTFAVVNCLPNGIAAWSYSGNCPALQATTAASTIIDSTGATSFTVTIPASCLAATAPAVAFRNTWNAQVTGATASMPSGNIQPFPTWQ